MENLINQSISPITNSEKSILYMVEGNNINVKNYGLYKNYRNQYPTYCNTLPPPPRDQINYSKYFNQKKCAYLSPNPYNNDECYFLEPNPTGPVDGKVGGYFCGGNSNNNYARGNIFGLNYPYNTPPVQEFNETKFQPNDLEYYDMNLNLRNFKNDYKLIETNPNYKSYPYNQSNTIIYRKN